MAPPPESRMARMWRNASYNLRRRIYREKMAKAQALIEEEEEEEEGAHTQEEPEYEGLSF